MINNFFNIIRGEVFTSIILYLISFLFISIFVFFTFQIIRILKEKIYSKIFLHDYLKSLNSLHNIYLNSEKIKLKSSFACCFSVGYKYFISQVKNNLQYNSGSLLDVTEKIMKVEIDKFFSIYYNYLKFLFLVALLIPFLSIFLFTFQFYNYSLNIQNNILLVFQNSFFILLLGVFYTMGVFILYYVMEILLDKQKEKSYLFIEDFIICLHKKFYVVDGAS